MSTNNPTDNYMVLLSTRSVTEVLTVINQKYIAQLPLIFTILGLIGFIGNLFTFLQPALRKNSFCIYTLLSSCIDVINLFTNLFPMYLTSASDNQTVAVGSSLTCKLRIMFLVALPQLSLNLLTMSLLDRYACTFGPASRIRRLLHLKMIPWTVTATVIISCVMSLYGPLLNDIIPGFGCTSTNATLNAIIYIGLHGILTPSVMLILTLLTYRNVSNSRKRVVSTDADLIVPGIQLKLRISPNCRVSQR